MTEYFYKIEDLYRKSVPQRLLGSYEDQQEEEGTYLSINHHNFELQSEQF